MPRIDPLQLLKCLSVLLSPDGGISSNEEVPRLVNLMSKFSKKLVSKCVYILILKNSKSHLVNMFMAEGGWNLIQSWLQDAMQISNWNLVNEILGLLLITPVDVERLKLNNIPKLVKNLSRRDDLEETQKLSSQLVQHWLVIVKSSNPPTTQTDIKSIEPKQDINLENNIKEDCDTVDNGKTDVVVHIDNEDNTAISTGTFYKVSVRDGKQIISKLVTEVLKNESEDDATNKKSHKSSSSKSSSSSSTKKSSSSGSSSSKSSSSSSKHRSSSSSSSKSSSSKDRSRDKDRRDRDKDRDRSRSNGSTKSSSKSSSSSSSKDKKDSKEKQAERDKDTLTKIKPQSIDKLGRIPKKPTDDKSKENKDVKRKPTMSIQERKSNEERPKTVKVFNSKMRSTGLEEEVKPPPPRPLKKPSVQLPTIPTKRPSPNRDSVAPPEKKIKVDIPERPGAIKLIPPKPKPAVLQESDIFMDALTASATAKKEPKKRKRRPSITKDTPTSPTTTNVTGGGGDQTSSANSPLGLKNIAPINFYQDTLTEEPATENDDQNNGDEDDDGGGKNERCVTPTDDDEEALKDSKIFRADGIKGVLLYTKKKGPKRSIQWKNDSDLVEVRYFELDETERVNVTKTFMDMAKMDISSEREALQRGRKTPNEDLMEPQILWRLPFIVDQPDPLVQPGSKSLEKDIQFAREKSVLQALYFDKRKIPDSPDEPMPENHQMSDPVIIPLEDADSQEIDLRNTPWPEPKGSPPHIENQMQPQIFPNIPGQFNTNFPQMPPPGFQPRFNGPGGNFGPSNMMPNGNMLPPNMGPPHDLINQQGQNMFGGPGGPDIGGGGGFPSENAGNFPLPFNPPNMNMFPPNNFNMNRGPMMNRGGFRRGGGGGNNNNGPWVRMSGPGPGGPGPNWNRGGGGGHHRGGGGGGGGGGRICKNIKNHGYCRNRDNCPFMHP